MYIIMFIYTYRIFIITLIFILTTANSQRVQRIELQSVRLSIKLLSITTHKYKNDWTN